MTEKELRQAVFTLHRYFVWADQMRSHFQELALAVGKVEDMISPEGAKLFMYMGTRGFM
jgi:hypothetical protein